MTSRNKMIFSGISLIIGIIFFVLVACEDSNNPAVPTVIDISAIQGITAPATGGTPATTITETAQYTGTVTWFPNHDTFAAVTQYMATITLTAKTGYTLQEVPANFFTVAGTVSVSNSANSGVINAVFPETAALADTVIDIPAIQGITAPATGGTPATAITETAQYTGTVSWSPNHDTFAAATQYTATITLTAKTGYTLQEVPANFFTVAGAVSVSNSANSGVINAVFPETASNAGLAQWARTVSSGNNSGFIAVTADAAGNVYAAGWQQGNSIYTYGPGVTAQGSTTSSESATGSEYVVLVKYDPHGTALWVRTVSTGNSSRFSAVTVDAAGNVYAAGEQRGNGIYTYGPEVTAQGSATGNSHSVVLVKYDSGGTAQWARTVSTDSTAQNNSCFHAVAVDAAGNVYAAGEQQRNGIYTYGPGVTAQGANPAGNNVVLVKYNPSGTALWVRTVSTGSSSSSFNAVAVDVAGNVYAAGSQMGTDIYTYGSGVTAQGSSPQSNNIDTNVVLVKYDSGGTAQWARTVNTGTIHSSFHAVAVDASGNVYAVGSQMGTDIYTYGPGVTAQGSGHGFANNVVLVKYNPSGTALWVQTVSTDSTAQNNSRFYAVAVDTSGNVYAAGEQTGAYIYTYGPGVTAQGSNYLGNPLYSGRTVVLVKYR